MLSHVMHTLEPRYFFTAPLSSAMGPLALHTSVWVMYKAGFSTHVNQPWFTLNAGHPKQSNGHSPFLSYFYISPADGFASLFHKDM